MAVGNRVCLGIDLKWTSGAVELSRERPKEMVSKCLGLYHQLHNSVL